MADDMPFGFNLFMGIVLLFIFFGLFKCNKNWYLKLSVIFWCIYTELTIFIGLGRNEDLINNPLFAIPLSIFSLGFLISIFAGIKNAMNSSLALTNIIGMIVIIALICTGIGAPIGIFLLIKALGRENGRRLNKK